MSRYNKEQSTVIAIWNLTRKNVVDPIPGNTAPESITNIVNMLGETHSSDSILLHTHGYDRLFHNRGIDKTITKLQIEIALELQKQGLVDKVHVN